MVCSYFYLYYAQDSSKKWQEILSKLGLTCPDDKCFKNFSSLFFCSFCFFLHKPYGETGLRDENISSLFCFFFFSCLLFFVIGLQRKLARGSRKFLVTFFLFFFLPLLYLYYAQDSSKKWQELFNKIGLTFPDERAVNFSSQFSFSSFSFSFFI